MSNWKKPFRGHVDASEFGVAGTLTQLDEEERDHVIAFSRIRNYSWKHRSRDVKNYVQGRMICQRKKRHQGKTFGDPTPLEVSSCRWDLLVQVSLPKTKNGFDRITTWVDGLSRRVHLIPSKETDSAVDVAYSFFRNMFPILV